MKWFKHKANMRHDVKLKRVIAKYGLEGYGLYNLIIESIVESLETESPLPILQDNVEDIAMFYNANSSHVAEMVSYMANQGLFDFTDNKEIVCVKVYKHLQASQTRSEQIRKLIASYDIKQLPSKTVFDNCEEQTTQDYTTQDKTTQEHKSKKPKKTKYGNYKNILLTDDEYLKLEKALDSRESWITKMDEAIEMKGYKYKSHYLALLSWYKKENKEPKKNSNTSGVFVDDSSPIKDIIHQEYKELYK